VRERVNARVDALEPRVAKPTINRTCPNPSLQQLFARDPPALLTSNRAYHPVNLIAGIDAYLLITEDLNGPGQGSVANRRLAAPDLANAP
jgi:hypothetical protein